VATSSCGRPCGVGTQPRSSLNSLVQTTRDQQPRRLSAARRLRPCPLSPSPLWLYTLSLGSLLLVRFMVTLAAEKVQEMSAVTQSPRASSQRQDIQGVDCSGNRFKRSVLSALASITLRSQVNPFNRTVCLSFEHSMGASGKGVVGSGRPGYKKGTIDPPPLPTNSSWTSYDSSPLTIIPTGFTTALIS
jgi:hypothetical protein